MATKVKERRLPKKQWGRKDFWLLKDIEGRRRKRIAAALGQIDRVADAMVKWGYDVELRQVGDQIPTLTIRDHRHFRATVALQFRPAVPESGGAEQWDPKVVVQAANLWDDIFHIGEYAERLRLMGRRLADAMKNEAW